MKYSRIVFLTDSKGNYLRTEIDKLKLGDTEIILWTRPGRNTKEGTEFLVKNIDQIRDGKLTLVVFWHLTCDLTRKTADSIFQRHRLTEDLIPNITPYLDVLKNIQQTEKHIDIGILEAPPIFTKKWNEIKEAEEWEITDDRTLHKQVSEVNVIVQSFNKELKYVLPRFVFDFQQRRRNKKKTSSRGGSFEMVNKNN